MSRRHGWRKSLPVFPEGHEATGGHYLRVVFPVLRKVVEMLTDKIKGVFLYPFLLDEGVIPFLLA